MITYYNSEYKVMWYSAENLYAPVWSQSRTENHVLIFAVVKNCFGACIAAQKVEVLLWQR